MTVRAMAAALTLTLATAVQAAEVHVMEAWSRATPPETSVGVGYLTLHNMGRKPLTLVGASSPRAQRVEIHETRIDDKGLSTMRPLRQLTVAAGAALSLSAGGRHLMLVGLGSPLVAGEKVPLTLQFEGEPPLQVQLEVRPLDAVAPSEHQHHHE